MFAAAVLRGTGVGILVSLAGGALAGLFRIVFFPVTVWMMLGLVYISTGYVAARRTSAPYVAAGLAGAAVQVINQGFVALFVTREVVSDPAVVAEGTLLSLGCALLGALLAVRPWARKRQAAS